MFILLAMKFLSKELRVWKRRQEKKEEGPVIHVRGNNILKGVVYLYGPPYSRLFIHKVWGLYRKREKAIQESLMEVFKRQRGI